MTASLTNNFFLNVNRAVKKWVKGFKRLRNACGFVVSFKENQLAFLLRLLKDLGFSVPYWMLL